MQIKSKDLKEVLEYVSELGPMIKKGGEIAYDSIKKFFNKANLNTEILKQKALIEKSKYDIGNVVAKEGLKAFHNAKIKTELEKIKKYETSINKYQKALKLVDKVPAKEFTEKDLNNLKNELTGNAQKLVNQLIKTVNGKTKSIKKAVKKATKK